MLRIITDGITIFRNVTENMGLANDLKNALDDSYYIAKETELNKEISKFKKFKLHIKESLHENYPYLEKAFKKISKATKKTLNVLTSKTATRILTIITATLFLTPAMLDVTAFTLTMSALIVGLAFETYKFHKSENTILENKLIRQYLELTQEYNLLIQEMDEPLKTFIKEPSLKKHPPSEEHKVNKLSTILGSIRDNSGESIVALVLSALYSSNPILIALYSANILVNGTAGAMESVKYAQKINDIKNANEQLKQDLPYYKNIDELKKLVAELTIQIKTFKNVQESTLYDNLKNDPISLAMLYQKWYNDATLEEAKKFKKQNAFHKIGHFIKDMGKVLLDDLNSEHLDYNPIYNEPIEMKEIKRKPSIIKVNCSSKMSNDNQGHTIFGENNELPLNNDNNIAENNNNVISFTSKIKKKYEENLEENTTSMIR